MKHTAKFTDTLFVAAHEICEAIHAHPFNRELASGTLALEKFQFYLRQDSLYLVDFAKALALMSARAPEVDEVEAFLDFSRGAVLAERGLHQHYFEQFAITADANQAPGCFAYTNFLLASASSREFSEAMAALLPCFWIYREVGKRVHATATSNNPYRKWIDTYAGTEFDAIVERAVTLTNRIADRSSSSQRESMTKAFLMSCRLEWLFWDSAHRLETWQPRLPDAGHSAPVFSFLSK